MDATVCVSGLPLWVVDDDLRPLCEQDGDVRWLRVVHDANGVSMGYAFIEMATGLDAARLVDRLHSREAFGVQLSAVTMMSSGVLSHKSGR